MWETRGEGRGQKFLESEPPIDSSSMIIIPLRGRMGGKLSITFFAYIIYRDTNKTLFVFAVLTLPPQRTSVVLLGTPISG